MQDQGTSGHLRGGYILREPTGCRIHKPEYDRAREAAETWSGQEGGLDHWALLDLLESAGVPERFGLRERHITYLRKAFKKLRSGDFEEGDWPPVVWMTKAKLARKVGVKPRAISNIERDLARAGFIYWSDTASRRRNGKRSKHDGRILWAYGVDFSPFAAMARDIEGAARLARDEEIERDGLVHEISTIRCDTRILLQAALRIGRAPASDLSALLTRALSLPSAKGMENSGVRVLRSLAEDARLIREQALALTKPRRAAPEEPTPEREEASDSGSPQADQGTKICTLGYLPAAGPNSITHQFQENTLVAPDSPDDASPEPTIPPGARQWPEREHDSRGRPGGAPVPGGPPAWLILESLSPRLTRFLPASRSPTADEFVRAANLGRSELGISPGAWREACTALSPVWASLAVVVVASRDDVGEIHTSAGGYFRKLTEQTRKEIGKLARSLWGVIERSEQLHVARITAPTEEKHSVSPPDSGQPPPTQRAERQRADLATMTAICRTAADPKGMNRAWRDLVARYRCWPYVDEVEQHYAALRSPFSGEHEGIRT